MTLVKKKDSAMIKRVDDSRVDEFVAKGFEVFSAVEPPSVEKPPSAEKPLSKMTVDELKAYASGKNITLPDGGLKADLLAAIEAAEATK